MERIIYKAQWNELKNDRKMVFISGPRQAGKTTLAKSIAKNYSNTLYYNYDTEPEKIILEPNFFENINRIDDTIPLVILDEIHKYKNWKSYLKGKFDKFGSDYQFILTGSGRMEMFNKRDDALTGRFVSMRLFPLTLREFKNNGNIEDFKKHKVRSLSLTGKNNAENIKNNLLEYSPFPEPFLKSNKRFYRRWYRTYINQIILQDIKDMTAIRHTKAVESLMRIMPERICAPLQYSSLSKLLQISIPTVKNWLNTLEQFFIVFSIMPYTEISRALIKNRKYYMYDYGSISDKGAKFENFVALELLQFVEYWNCMGEGEFELRYLKNKEQQEIDFIVLLNGKPFLIIEAKSGDESISKSVYKFQNSLNVPVVQLVNKPKLYKKKKNNKNDIYILSAAQFLSNLP
ncbi:MAG: AAA family ATPase [bacterium]